ncbi:F-box ubiquitin ligase [Maudiozyma exigua]|uniref:F-box ubiquitin ligase n=1 Tax=Maudiozyma exigua TaxID=34358 RepID=A0A9P7BBU3_MAUEX|nr:F-box ubiquitin ligase [Kazachstania exigua]
MSKITKQYSLETLPIEILFNILAYLDEPDLCNLQQISPLLNLIITDDELWKYLFRARLNTNKFPSVSKSNDFHTEYITRRDTLLRWRHNRVIRTKYAVTPFRTPIPTQANPMARNNFNNIENLVFAYPRCACYHDGTITLIHLQNKRSRQRLTYIPCTTPQGCSTLDFSINAAVFGRFDGRVFGKLLSNKSYLTPATEFNSSHSTCVTAIASLANDTSHANEHRCVSGSENGELIWWEDTKKVTYLKPTNSVIWKLYYWKDFTLALDHDRLYVIVNHTTVHSLILPLSVIRPGMTRINPNLQSQEILQFINVDFGSKTLIMASNSTLFTICFDPNNSFGALQSIKIKDIFPNISTTITNIYLDESTALKEQDFSLAGNDGCYIAVQTSDNDIAIINIRNIATMIKIQTTLSFDEQIHAIKITNLLLVVAIANQIHIMDSSTGSPIKTIQKTDKYPQFLDISENKILVGSGNLLHLLEFISSKNKKLEGDENDVGSTSTTKSHKNRSTKWIETLNSQIDNFDEDENYRRTQRQEHDRLLETYGGDITPTSRYNDQLLTMVNDEDVNDDDIQLRIALLESQSTNIADTSHTEDNEEEQLRRAIEESQRLQDEDVITALNAEDDVYDVTEHNDDDDDDEFRRALELSRNEREQSHRPSSRTVHLLAGDSAQTTNSAIQSSNAASNSAMSEDEELQLALALSLSEIN